MNTTVTGIVCLAALASAFAGCSGSEVETQTVDVSTLDSFTQAAVYAKSGNVNELKAIITADQGIVQAVDESGMTLLHYAAAGAQPDTIKLLLDNGADVNAADDGGDIPLDCAEDADADQAVLDMLQTSG